MLQLAAEELSVTKKTAETGRVRVSTQTKERDVLVDENLAHETVEIERVPVGQRIETAPEVRQDGDITIIPVVEEVLAVEKRLMLKEEIRIRRVRTTERHQEKVTLRHQEAVVRRHKSDTGNAGVIDPSTIPGTPSFKERNNQAWEEAIAWTLEGFRAINFQYAYLFQSALSANAVAIETLFSHNNFDKQINLVNYLKVLKCAQDYQEIALNSVIEAFEVLCAFGANPGRP